MRRLVAKERHRHATEGERVGLCEVVESAHRRPRKLEVSPRRRSVSCTCKCTCIPCVSSP
eukprot:scaffold19803_cov64-Phaeocystis_antarctica.AAC.4